MQEHFPIQRPPSEQPEPLWPAFVAVFAVGSLYWALPESLSLGPSWLLLALIVALIVAILLAYRQGHHALHFVLGHLLDGIVTLFLLWSVTMLVGALPAHHEPPTAILRSGAVLWLANVLVFTSWYWRLDAGGPHERAKRVGHPTGAFLFPQMSWGHKATEADGRPWSPRFMDYLFLAFTTSTALSPTDTPVLSRWAKAMMIAQAILSLTIVVILLARAVNML